MGAVASLLSQLAVILRPIVMWVATQAATLVAWSILDQVLNKVQDTIKDYYGIGDADAGAVTVNILLDVVTYTGIGSAFVWLNIGPKTAARMGLDRKKPAKKTVTPVAAAKIGAVDLKAGGKGYKGLLTTILKITGVSAGAVWLASAVANIFEPGIYKPEQTNAVYKALGIPFQYPTGSGAGTPGGFESAEFTDYFRALETVGAYAIENPCLAMSVVFSRDALSALVDCIYGREAAAGNPTTAAKLKPKLAPYIKVPAGATVPISSGSSSGSGTSGSSSGSGASTPTVKVFTGIVSQGIVGKGTTFEARPDDLIQSVDELRSAAANNLSAYLAALPRKIVYEVKIVPSVVTRDGFKQTGTTQRIVSGSYTDGTPKYKTVTNKFAVIVVYAVTDKGTRTKLTQITLGPTDSAKLLVAQNDLRELETSLPSIVTTTDLDEVSNIAHPEEVTTKKLDGVPPGIYQQDGVYYQIGGDGSVSITTKPERGGARSISVNLSQYVTGGSSGSSGSSGASNPERDAAPVVSKPSTPSVKTGGGAATLSEWYQAQGLPLPPVSERAMIYQGLGLGQSSYYTGTTEQNSKLLAALKEKQNF